MGDCDCIYCRSQRAEHANIDTTEGYEEFVCEMAAKFNTDSNYCVVAINEEAGEVAGFWKKYELRKNPNGKLKLNDLKEELGDLLFYITRLGGHYGWSIMDIIQGNVEKLRKRWKNDQEPVLCSFKWFTGNEAVECECCLDSGHSGSHQCLCGSSREPTV